MVFVESRHQSSALFSLWTILFTVLVSATSLQPEARQQTSYPLPSQTSSPQFSCNSSSNRQCWTKGFNIHTDYEEVTPYTGEKRNYVIELTEINNYVAGDGSIKTKAMLVNGSFPGPTLTANWGDIIEITVINNLLTNGTSIHMHGVRQLHTNQMDGSNGITECPLPPRGASKTYRFLATQYGTSWYHSHFSAQYGNGVLGPLIIHGPASANYDIDLGPMMVSDWYTATTEQISARINDPDHPYTPGMPGSAPWSDNILFNGLNVAVSNGDSNGSIPYSNRGQYEKVTLTPGKTHLLRLINPSVENSFVLSLSGHNMTIVASDFVPINPVPVTSLYIGIGQRYDVLIKADQATDSYWFNATLPTGPCGKSKNPYPAAIFTYSAAEGSGSEQQGEFGGVGGRNGSGGGYGRQDGGNPKLPSSPGTKPAESFCADPLHLFQPVVPRFADISKFQPSVYDTLTDTIVYNYNGVHRVYWPVNGVPMRVSWNDPTLEYVMNHSVQSMPVMSNLISVPEANATTFWLLENNSSMPHPMHLHGHDVLLLGASDPLMDPQSGEHGLQSYNPATDTAKLNGNNPTRRDTIMLPAFGWAVIAFKTNNPGAWLFHCHIAWHISQGFSVQFLEQEDAIPRQVDLSQVSGQCRQWDAYYPSKDPYHQEDSGI